MRTFLLIFISLLFIQCNQKTESKNSISSTPIQQRFTDYTDFTLEESRQIHKRFSDENWGKSLEDWANNGNDSRYIFLNFGEFFPTTVIKKSSNKTKILPLALSSELANFETKTRLGKLPLHSYVKKASVNGLIIIKNGKILFEDYPRMLPTDKHLYMSVTKIFVSTAIAILEDKGLIDSNLSIDKYLKELKGTDWEEVTIRNILDMASGADCPVDFNDPNSCFAQVLKAYGVFNFNQPMYHLLDFYKKTKFSNKQGQVYEYSEINPILLTTLLEEVTNERFVKFIEREIWQKIGSENDALFQNGAFGRAASSLGVNSTLRDLARFGLAFTPSGRTAPKPIISDKHLLNIQKNVNKKLRTKSWPSNEQKYNSYQWNEVYDDGDFIKFGHKGQGLYISPSLDLVIAYFGTSNNDEPWNELPLICRQIVNSGLLTK